MPNAWWPDACPAYFDVAGYSEQMPAALLVSQGDALPRRRQRFRASSYTVRGRFNATSDQLAALDTFVNSTLKGGVLPFDWVHPRTGGIRTFRFASPPTYSSVTPDHWLVSVDLEMRGDRPAPVVVVDIDEDSILIDDDGSIFIEDEQSLFAGLMYVADSDYGDTSLMTDDDGSILVD